MFKLEDRSLKFSPSDINTSVKISLFVKDETRQETKIRERFIDIDVTTMKQRKLKIVKAKEELYGDGEFKLLSEPIEEIVKQVRERRILRAKILEQNIGQMEEEYSPSREKNLTLVKKYEPTGYIDLIGDEVVNRGLLKWLKSWEIPVFGGKKYKAKTRELEPWKQYTPFKKKVYKYTSDYWKTKMMLEKTDLGIKDECEKLKNRIPMIVGESGTCKTSLAKIIAKHCKYDPVVVNLSTVKSVDDLIELIKNETQSYNIASMSMAMNQKKELNEIKKEKKNAIFDLVGAKQSPQGKKKEVKIKKRPTCLILDEIDSFFSTDTRAQWKLLNFLYRNKSQNQIEELFTDESKSKKELSTKRPIILVAENMFSKGLMAFRRSAVIFRVYKNHEVVYKKVSQICQAEKLNISNDIVAKICTAFKDHLGAILNFLDMIRKGAVTKRAEIESLLQRTSIEQIETDYFSIFRTLFDKSKRNRQFNSRTL